MAFTPSDPRPRLNFQNSNPVAVAETLSQGRGRRRSVNPLLCVRAEGPAARSTRGGTSRPSGRGTSGTRASASSSRPTSATPSVTAGYPCDPGGGSAEGGRPPPPEISAGGSTHGRGNSTHSRNSTLFLKCHQFRKLNLRNLSEGCSRESFVSKYFKYLPRTPCHSLPLTGPPRWQVPTTRDRAHLLKHRRFKK